VAIRGVAAVLLDAHGTLVDLEPPGPVLSVLLRERFAVDASPEEATRALGAEIAYYRAHLGEGRDAESLADLRGRCAAVLREALPPSPALARVGSGELTAVLLDSLRFRVFPEVHEALGAIRALGIRAVVASNWDVSLPDVLGRLGLGDMLDGVVASAQVGAAKPDGTVFRAALRIAGAGPQDAVHVGDRIDEDVAGARAAGIEPVLIRRDAAGGPPPAGVATIASLAELPALLSP
jgi:putative hydrolase of the HAD superfamily